MAGGAETPNIAALPAIARLGTCESARGPDADRHVKLLSQFAVEGSLSGAYSHPKFALELANLKVEVIFARGTWALAAARNATRTIPIVGIDLEIDPVEAGLVESIARPGGNITGLFLDLSELSGKHLQILKEIIPGTSRVAVLGRPDINATQIRELERVARSLAVQIRAVDVKNATDLDGAFDTAKIWRADALIVLSNPLSLAYRTQIGAFAEKTKLPTIFLYRA